MSSTRTADSQLIDVFERLVEVAAEYKAVTGGYLQIWSRTR